MLFVRNRLEPSKLVLRNMSTMARLLILVLVAQDSCKRCTATATKYSNGLRGIVFDLYVFCNIPLLIHNLVTQAPEV